MQHIGKLHRLYVAAPLANVIEVVAKTEEDFTSYSATGYFRGEEEPMVVVEIASDNSEAVVTPGRTLRECLTQDGVGYVVDGEYSRITAN